MKAKIVLCSLAIIFSGLLMFSSSVLAVTPNPECVQDAKAERNLCITKCQEEFRVDKDACRNVDHDCADLCRINFEDCVETPLTELAACKAVCLSNLQDAKIACRGQYLPGTQARDICIDAAQLEAFVCKDGCREDVASDLKTCRNTFRTFIKACPPPAP